MKYSDAIERHLTIPMPTAKGTQAHKEKPRYSYAGEDIRKGEVLEFKDGRAFPKKADSHGEGADDTKPLYNMTEE
jgi:hypothetical protein